MIDNLRISVAELAVWALLAAAGLTWISLRALDGAAWLMDWLRDRVTPLLEDEDDLPEEWDHDELELPPERTWEQMTSHQLPVVGPSARIRDWLERDDPAEDDGPDGCVVPSSPESASAAAAMRTPIGTLTAARERRAPWWETEQRQAYAALGLEFPSGLVARVREAAQ